MAQTATPQDNGSPKRRTTGTRAKLQSARESATSKARATVETLEANPMSVLVGGLAVGLVAGALIPRSDREKKMLKPVGKRLAAGAVAAVAAAKETGKDQLSASMLSRDAAKESARKVFESAVQAAKEPATGTSSKPKSQDN